MGKRGAAPKDEFGEKSAVLSTRITADLRGWLEESSNSSGRTLSHEIERRLRQSFIEDDKIIAAFGTRRNYALWRTIASAAQMVSDPMWLDPAVDPALRAQPTTARGDEWIDDPALFDAAVRTVAEMLKAIRPERAAASAVPRSVTKADRIEFSRAFAAFVWERIQQADAALPLDQAGQGSPYGLYNKIKADLGEVASRPLIAPPKVYFDDDPELSALPPGADVIIVERSSPTADSELEKVVRARSDEHESRRQKKPSKRRRAP